MVYRLVADRTWKNGLDAQIGLRLGLTLAIQSVKKTSKCAFMAVGVCHRKSGDTAECSQDRARDAKRKSNGQTKAGDECARFFSRQSHFNERLLGRRKV